MTDSADAVTDATDAGPAEPEPAGTAGGERPENEPSTGATSSNAVEEAQDPTAPASSGGAGEGTSDISDDIGLVWFRRDLRVDDNPAWAAATRERKYVVPLFVVDPRVMDSVGPFRRRMMIANLQALDYDLAERLGGRLLVRFGDPAKLVPEAVEVFHAGAVYWNNDVSPFATRRDAQVAAAIDVPIHRSWGNLVLPPGSVLTKKASVSRVFTPFHNAWKATTWDAWPEPADAVVLDDPGEFLPHLDAAPPLFEGPNEARMRLERFLEVVDRYDTDRDRPDRSGTSMLSADLRFGTLSARTVFETVGDTTSPRRDFQRQLAWRDWYAHLLHDLPSMATAAVSDKFEHIQWRNHPADIAAWKGGFTGYPIVDAGMRQLRETGWMHNRVRMIVGSFLVKDLLVDWRIGEAHFRHLLTDYDPPQNIGNWQWVAGTGCDAAPYFRIFNPVTQSKKFDPDGAYIRRWVPELAALSGTVIHAPWDAPPSELSAAGVIVGDTYPAPVVLHDVARDRALAAYKEAENLASGAGTSTDAEAPA